MKSYQTLYTDYKTISQNSVAANETLGKSLINDSQRILLAHAPWKFLEVTNTVDTVASQANYQIPNNIRKLTNVKVTVGTTVYRPKLVEDDEYWEYLQALNTGTSDACMNYYRKGNEIFLYPTPASDDNTITIKGKKKWRDLLSADYSTQTIAAMTNGDATVSGAGATAWTGIKPVAGKWLRPTPTSGDGDYNWYEINSITSDTALELVKLYEGVTFAGKTVAYVIGDFSVIPSSFHDLMLWRSLAIYFMQNAQDKVRADRFWRMYDGGYEAGLEKKVGGMLKVMMDDQLETDDAVFIDQLSAERDNLRNFRIDTVTGESW